MRGILWEWLAGARGLTKWEWILGVLLSGGTSVEIGTKAKWGSSEWSPRSEHWVACQDVRSSERSDLPKGLIASEGWWNSSSWGVCQSTEKMRKREWLPLRFGCSVLMWSVYTSSWYPVHCSQWGGSSVRWKFSEAYSVWCAARAGKKLITALGRGNITHLYVQPVCTQNL